MVCVSAAREASAQTAPWSDRGYINVGWGVESGSSAMTDSRTSTIYDETATISSAATFTSGSLFDVGVGFRVWRNLTIGAGYHQEQNDTDGQVSGSIPSPVFFNRPRTLNETIPGLNRKEQATHLMIGWVMPFGAKFDVLVSGGPSFFRVEQDAVSSVTIGEEGGAFTTVAGAADDHDQQEEPDRLQRRRGCHLHRVAERQRSRRCRRFCPLHQGRSQHADVEHRAADQNWRHAVRLRGAPALLRLTR